MENEIAMATLGIRQAFSRYDAKLRNVQWSVSAWAPNGSLVVSLWEHHRRKSMRGSIEFAANANRWKGPGNKEFRENVQKAFEMNASIRLIIVRTNEVARVEAGEDAGKIPKEFEVRDNLIGRVIEWDGENYAFRFTRAAP
jgi:hypothetical protein